MKFHLAINLERVDSALSMQDVARHTLEMVHLAEDGGFEVAWAAEHHALEMTIAPNPFQILTWWGTETSNIRLGTGVANAAYWHPINLAGEAAFLDLISGGRLEFGIGSGAYQREFDRMRPGLKQSDAWQYMQEMLPAVRALWQGDYAHDGTYWQFPTSTAVPKPSQRQVPVWVAARSPITYDYAIRERAHIMCWPLTRPHAEAELYRRQLDEAIAKADNGWTPRFALMRHTCIYGTPSDRQRALDAIRTVLSQFENLFRNAGQVKNGFPASIPLDQLTGREQYDPEMLEENLLFGSPETAIAKLQKYKDLGVSEFIYYASMGVDFAAQKRSLKLFIEEVMPQMIDAPPQPQKQEAHTG